MPFEPAATSAEQQTLLSLVASDPALKVDAVRTLFWLIDAHPNLLCFVQIAENLAKILETQPIQCLDPVGRPWVKNVPAWQAFCRWLAEKEPDLKVSKELANVFLRPAKPAAGPKSAGLSRTAHPLNDMGLSRHGIYATLWNRHESGQGAITGGVYSNQYLSLQAQLLIALATAREKLSRREDYFLHYEKVEFSRKPIGSYPASLAVRDLSRSAWSPLLSLLNPATPVDVFCTNMEEVIKRRPVVNGQEASTIIGHLKKIQGLVKASDELTGKAVKPAGKKTSGHKSSGSGGRGKHLPGYVNLAPHLYRHVLIDKVAWAGQVEVVCLTPNLDEDEREAELAGDAPGERTRTLLALYNPQELKGALARARTAQRIRQTLAQRFAWDIVQPTPQQVCYLLALLDGLWRTYLGAPNNVAHAKQAQLALLLEVMLLFGKSIEGARALRLRQVDSVAAREFALLVEPVSDQTEGNVYAMGKAARLVPRGWRLPAIEPDYATSLPEHQRPFARPRAQSFEIPDISGLAGRIAEYCRRQQKELNDTVFSFHDTTVGLMYKALVEAHPALKGLTLARLRQLLETTVHDQCGDWALAWHVAGDESIGNQPRMFYAGFPVSRVQAAVIDAQEVLLKRWGRPCEAVLQASNLQDGGLWIGARFIVTTEALSKLLHEMQIRMALFSPRSSSVREWVGYHNDYTLYTWMLQSLNSGLRAINDPVEMIEQCSGRGFGQRTVVTLADKETEFLDRARPVLTTSAIARQLTFYGEHVRTLCQSLGIRTSNFANASANRALFWLDDQCRPGSLTRGTIEKAMADIGFPFPGNFGRAYLRVELAALGCDAEWIDAFLGHGNDGERPFGPLATFDYGRHFRAIDEALEVINRSLNLVPAESRLSK